ncbi:MAG TPA: DNA-directed RNA polymerase sigma-70 factor, partial [Planctomycetes bacterium]|nr:DNA-directed RNA polymerase sigma-70 factor [Planctomycetota bacterium]
APPPPSPAPAPKPKVDPHAEARAIWAAYEAHEARVAPARAHCSRVVSATAPRQGRT